MEAVDLLVVGALAFTLFVAVAFVVLRARERGERAKKAEAPAAVTPAAEEAGDVEAVDVEAVAEAPPSIAVPKIPPRRPARGIAAGLERTRGALRDRIAGVVRRDRLDDESWDELEDALIRADVGVKASLALLERVRQRNPSPAEVTGALKEELSIILDTPGRQLKTAEGRPSVWLVVGVNGVGKTTTIAKVAHNLIAQRKSVVLAAADTYRAGASDQLKVWGERVGAHVIAQSPGSDPGAVVFDAIAHAKAQGVDVVIADTAGRLHTRNDLMDELRKIKRVAEREAGGVDEVLLVLDATVGQNGIAQAGTFREAVEVTGVVLTKLDGTARGGIVVAIQQELAIPVKAVGVGEGMEDLRPFLPAEFASALID